MITFHSNTAFHLEDPETYREWILATIENESKQRQEIEYVFVSDEELYKINMEYLGHDTLTDIITFDYGVGEMIAGEIYISTERVTENAETFKVLFENELARVMIHGILHLCGYKDASSEEKKLMRYKEGFYLKKLEILLQKR